MRARKEDRNKKALELRLMGLEYQEIADKLGLCYARTWTIVHEEAKRQGVKV